MPRRRVQAFTTVLFTDIVDSTRIASELGDRTWKAILERHDRLVRRQLKRFGGRELDSAGDGFFAAFDDRAAAIRCACAVADGVHDFGLEIRCGLNVGQAEIIGSKVAGLMVVTGARIMSVAAANEVLVSRVLRDLVPGSGITFEDRGLVRLKGIDEEAQLFAVLGLDGEPRTGPLRLDEASRIRGTIHPTPLRDRPRTRIVLAAGLLGLITVAAIGAVSVARKPPPIPIRANSLLRIDPNTGEFLADIAVYELGSPPAEVPSTHEIWLSAKTSQVISIIDAASNDRNTLGGISISQAEGQGYGMTYLDGSVWVSEEGDEVVPISPETHLAGPPIQLHGGINLLAAGEGYVWASAHDAQRVFGIDPDTRDITVKGEIGTGSNGIGIGFGSVWVANYSSGTVSRVDPNTGSSHEIVVGVEKTSGGGAYLAPGGPSSFAFGFGSVWITDPQFGVVYRLDPDTEMITDTIRVGPGGRDYVSGVAIADRTVWVTDPTSKTLVRVNPTTGGIDERFPLPFKPQDVMAAYGSIWVTIWI